MPEEATARKTTTRKRTTRTTTARKAPTQTVASVAVEPRRRSLAPFIAVAVFIVLVGGSAAIGFTDGGQINVSDTISDRRANGTPEEQAQIQNIPVQQTRPNQPLGGLVPSTNKPEPAPVPEPQVESASTTATSSDEAAGETEEGSTEQTTDEAAGSEEETNETPVDTAETTPTEETVPESTDATTEPSAATPPVQ